jgi:small subunit ribosomal protein S11
MAKQGKNTATAKTAVVKKKSRKSIAKGIIHITATFNNTTVAVTDEMGNVVAWSSAGALKFKGSKKSTPFAAQQAVDDALTKAKEHGLKEVGIKVQGPGSGRETAIKTAGSTEGIRVSYIKDVTPLPHNGCRPPKRRRV